MVCSNAGSARLGDYRNIGLVSARGVVSGEPTADTDPSAYYVEDPPPVCITRDFEGLSKGAVVTRVPGAAVSGTRTIRAFDTAHPTCGDTDLVTPGYGSGNTVARGKSLILAASGSCQPNDHAGGGTIVFDFDEPNRVTGIGLLDTEEWGGRVRGYLGNEKVLDVSIPTGNDNGWQLRAVGSQVLTRLEVQLAGSGSVTEIFCGGS